MIVWILVCAWLFSNPAEAALPRLAVPVELKNRAEAPSAEPNLCLGADGKLYMSWIAETSDGVATLQFSAFENDGWQPPRAIAQGSNWFVNWADFPSIAVLADGTLAAHWLAKTAADTYAYQVQIALSSDGGRTWGKPITPHRDGTPTEHGFVSMFPVSRKAFGLFWLDGRAMEKDGPMALRFTTLSKDGKLGKEVVVDDRVCECCQTGAIGLPGAAAQALVVYRDRDLDEVRDISIRRITGGGVQSVKGLRQDGWKINGCPVNGPSIATHDKDVTVAWFSGAEDKSRVRVAFSRDHGQTFAAPIEVDGGNPIGRVDVVALGGGSAVVSWIETVGDGAEIHLRVVNAAGERGTITSLGATLKSRASGFPRMERLDNHLIVAWTDVSSQRVRTARVALNRDLEK